MPHRHPGQRREQLRARVLHGGRTSTLMVSWEPLVMATCVSAFTVCTTRWLPGRRGNSWAGGAPGAANARCCDSSGPRPPGPASDRRPELLPLQRLMSRSNCVAMACWYRGATGHNEGSGSVCNSPQIKHRPHSATQQEAAAGEATAISAQLPFDPRPATATAR